MKWSRRLIYQDVSGYKNENDQLSNKDRTAYKKFCANVFFQPGGNTLRLKTEGVTVLETYYTSHIVEIIDKTQTKKNMPAKHYVFLTRYCKGPYYIGSRSITFFDEDEAFIFKMCDGDIDNVKTVAN